MTKFHESGTWNPNSPALTLINIYVFANGIEKQHPVILAWTHWVYEGTDLDLNSWLPYLEKWQRNHWIAEILMFVRWWISCMSDTKYTSGSQVNMMVADGLAPLCAKPSAAIELQYHVIISLYMAPVHLQPTITLWGTRPSKPLYWPIGDKYHSYHITGLLPGNPLDPSHQLISLWYVLYHTAPCCRDLGSI